MTDKFEEAIAALDLALARAHMRHNRNGTVSMVNAYQRVVPGDYLKVGDTVIDSFGKKRKVAELDDQTVTFDDFTKQPKNSPFRVIDSETDAEPDSEKQDDAARKRRMTRAKKQDPFKADVQDPFVNRAPLSNAEAALEVALAQTQVDAHTRRTASGKIAHVNSYFRLVKGKDVKVGDIVSDSFGRKKTVISVTPNSVIFNDFSTQPSTDSFRVDGEGAPEPFKPNDNLVKPSFEKKPVLPVSQLTDVELQAEYNRILEGSGRLSPEDSRRLTTIKDEQLNRKKGPSKNRREDGLLLSEESEDSETVELAATKVSGHQRRSKTGKIYHVDSYIRRTSGHDISVGDTIRDTYGKEKKVTGKSSQTLSFDDGSSSPTKSKFERVEKAGSTPSTPKPATNKWSDIAPRAIPSKERKQRSDKVAADIAATAKKVEPSLTALIKAEVEKLGGKLVGLENKLKPQSEISQKIEKRSLERGISPEVQKNNIKDSIQYTVTHANDKIVETAEALHKALTDKGHSVAATRNSWSNNSPYRGIHSSMISPEGNYYEIQFHTPASYKAKQEANDAFKIIHDLNTPLRLRQLRWQKLMNIWLNIPFPLYWQRLGRLQYYNSPVGPPRKDFV
jgi:hypothetical protein